MNTPKITLAQLLAAMTEPTDHLFIIQEMRPGASEAVGGGTVAEVKTSHCVEVCGDRPVERIVLDGEGYPWDHVPVLIVTIGREAAT